MYWVMLDEIDKGILTLLSRDSRSTARRMLPIGVRHGKTIQPVTQGHRQGISGVNIRLSSL